MMTHLIKGIVKRKKKLKKDSWLSFFFFCSDSSSCAHDSKCLIPPPLYKLSKKSNEGRGIFAGQYILMEVFVDCGAFGGR